LLAFCSVAAAGWNKKENELCAKLSFAAYCAAGSAKGEANFRSYWAWKSFESDPELKLVSGFGHGGGANVGLVLISPKFKKVITVFRGTDNDAGWSVNKDYDLVGTLHNERLHQRCPKMKVHKGFYHTHQRSMKGKDSWLKYYLEARKECREINGGEECGDIFRCVFFCLWFCFFF
jgi:hypothetical protein